MSRIIIPAGVEVSGGWTRVDNPGIPEHCETFVHRLRMLSAIRSQDEGRWHLSVAHVSRIPTWEGLGHARDHLIPADVWMMVPHPPRRYWLNLNRRVLHLWEFRDDLLIEQFKFEGEMAQRARVGTPDSGT
jgi:hypothetical protein